MAATELKIDDDYVTEMGKFISTSLDDLDTAYQTYITIMTGIKDEALMKGDTAEALEKFISYAEYLKEKVAELGETAKTLSADYITDIDEMDSYLF